jgi:hypothetical protein
MPNDDDAPAVSSGFDDIPIRARLHAQGLLLAEMMADRLAAQIDPVRCATELLRVLLETAAHESFPDARDGEQARLQDHVKLALFELCSAAVNRLPEAARDGAAGAAASVISGCSRGISARPPASQR